MELCWSTILCRTPTSHAEPCLFTKEGRTSAHQLDHKTGWGKCPPPHLRRQCIVLGSRVLSPPYCRGSEQYCDFPGSSFESLRSHILLSFAPRMYPQAQSFPASLELPFPVKLFNSTRAGRFLVLCFQTILRLLHKTQDPAASELSPRYVTRHSFL